MTQILPLRLRNQRLSRPVSGPPEALVAWLGAVQAQDYGGAKWALALRSQNLAESAIDRAVDDGRIVRTHVMRPTWHFVAAADIRWLLALTGPRVHAVNAYYYRECGLDAPTLTRARRVLTRTLDKGQPRTRTQLATALAAAGIPCQALRLAYLVMHTELEGVICSGPRQGKQFTYVLLDAHLPPVPALTRDEALETLARRYFTSHGPATIRDFSWWSGLTMRDARRAVDMCGTALERLTSDDLTWYHAAGSDDVPTGRGVYLLPNYDEYLIAYKDRDIGRDPHAAPRLETGPELGYHLVIDTRVAGSWRRTITKRTATIEVRPYRKLTREAELGIAAQAKRFAAFSGLDVEVVSV